MLNLAAFLEDSALKHPHQLAVVAEDERLDYATVNARANQVANLLVERGVRPGDKVALSCTNRSEFAVVYYGILKAGGVVIPLNVLLKAREVAYHLNDGEVVAYFCLEDADGLATGTEGYAGFRESAAVSFFLISDGDDAETLSESVPTLMDAIATQPAEFETVATEPTDTAVILYTSGTTGRPKGAELTHSNMVMNVLTSVVLFQIKPASDVILVALPLFHAFGSLAGMNVAFATAGTMVTVPRFDAERVLHLMEQENVTIFGGVPTMWWSLLDAADTEAGPRSITPSLRVGLSGGAALPGEISKRVKERFGITVLEGYGLSETSPAAIHNVPDREPRTGSIGVPFPGVQVKLINDDWSEVTEPGEIGEIAIRGHNVMKGYYNRPEATAEVIRDGWFRSGDLGRRDEDGFYYVVDRSKDMIIRGGYNVYPREIEDVLMTHPDVSLAAVIGVPHDKHGEEVKAFIIKTNGRTCTEQQLVEWAKNQMAAYKYPRIIEFADDLPMTATGKILKRELS